MRISALIKHLREIKKKHGDCKCFGNAPFYEPDFSLKKSNVVWVKEGQRNDFTPLKNFVVIGPD